MLIKLLIVALVAAFTFLLGATFGMAVAGGELLDD